MHEMTWIDGDDEREMMMMDYGMMDAKQMIIMNKIIEKLFKWNDDRSEGKMWDGAQSEGKMEVR